MWQGKSLILYLNSWLERTKENSCIYRPFPRLVQCLSLVRGSPFFLPIPLPPKPSLPEGRRQSPTHLSLQYAFDGIGGNGLSLKLYLAWLGYKRWFSSGPFRGLFPHFLLLCPSLVPCRIYSFLNDLESSFALEIPVGAAYAVPLPPAKSESVFNSQTCQFGP